VAGAEAEAEVFEDTDRHLHTDVDHKMRVEVEVVPAALVCRRGDRSDLVAVSMKCSPLTYGCNFAREVSLRQLLRLQLQPQWKMSAAAEQAAELVGVKGVD
jgi:hypothetical protein